MNKEIEVKELRIGNYITFDGGIPTRVYELTEYFINDCHPKETNIQGIPLSPAILEKAGFKKDWREDAGGAPFFVWYNGFDIHQNEEGTEFHFAVYVRWDGTFKGGYHIKTLHQLQNLYFALTGQELQITL